MTAGEVLRRAAGYLAGKGCDTPRLDAEVLLAHVLGVDRLALYTGHDRPMSPAETDAYRAAVARRGAREPVAYIVGRRSFRRLELIVSQAVLVPRPETEHLVEWAVGAARRGGAALDWGTGSGAVALALADERPDLRVTGVDRSARALATAQANDAGSVVEWIVSDGFAALPGRRFALIAANPPYLAAPDLADAEPELGFEPREALVAGPTGLEALERLAAESRSHLEPGGWLLSEVGAGQAARTVELWTAAGLVEVTTRNDLAGVARIVGGRLP